MKEKWIRWELSSNLSSKYYVEAITDRIEDNFNMILSDSSSNKKVLISFQHGVDAYRNTNESYTSAIITYLDKTYGKDFYAKWTFFKVENSEYLKWLSEKSYGISDDYKLMHFCIVAADSIVDIACTYEPNITLEESLKDCEILKTTTANIEDDAKNLHATNFEDNSIGKSGTLPDGRIVNVRKHSHDGKAILEIYNPINKERIKIRYGNK